MIRYVSIEERGPVLATCMDGEGFPNISVTPLGDLHAEGVPQDQREYYMIAIYVCSQRYPLDPKYDAPLTDAQLDHLYDYLIATLRPCLESNDIVVPSAPSRQTFVDTGGWAVYENVGSSVASEEEWFEINVACPQLPPDLY